MTHPVLTSYIPCSLCPWYQTYRALINTITCLPNWLPFPPLAYTNLTSMEPDCFITSHPYLPHTHPHSHTRHQTISFRPSYIPSLPWNKSSTLTSRTNINWKSNETSKNDIVILFETLPPPYLLFQSRVILHSITCYEEFPCHHSSIQNPYPGTAGRRGWGEI